MELFEIQKLAKTNFRESEIKRAFLFSCFTGLRQSDVRKFGFGNTTFNGLLLECF